MQCNLEFKLCNLKNPKFFSIRVKELFELTVSRKIGDGFWVILRQKFKILKGISHSTENRLSRNKMWRAVNSQNYMCHIAIVRLSFNLKQG